MSTPADATRNMTASQVREYCVRNGTITPCGIIEDETIGLGLPCLELDALGQATAGWVIAKNERPTARRLAASDATCAWLRERLRRQLARIDAGKEPLRPRSTPLAFEPLQERAA